MHLTSAAARTIASKLAAEYPDILRPAEAIRLPGVDAYYLPAVQLRHGATAPANVGGVVVWEGAPEPTPPVPKARATPATAQEGPKRLHRSGQREKALVLLGRPNGVTSRELAERLGILPHSARSLLSHLGRETSIERGKDRRYRASPSVS